LKNLKAQLELARVTLDELRVEPCSYSVLEKRVLIRNGTFATVPIILYFLRDSGYIIKESSEHRAPYKLSTKGEKLLEALS
jgi:predicted transcriptional regulator